MQSRQAHNKNGTLLKLIDVYLHDWEICWSISIEASLQVRNGSKAEELFVFVCTYRFCAPG